MITLHILLPKYCLVFIPSACSLPALGVLHSSATQCFCGSGTIGRVITYPREIWAHSGFFSCYFVTTDAYCLGFLQQTPPLLHLLLVLAVEPLHNLLIKLHVTLDEFSFFFFGWFLFVTDLKCCPTRGWAALLIQPYIFIYWYSHFNSPTFTQVL